MTTFAKVFTKSVTFDANQIIMGVQNAIDDVHDVFMSYY